VAHAPQRAAIAIHQIAHDRIGEDVPEPQQHEKEAGHFQPEAHLIGIERRQVYGERQPHSGEWNTEAGKGEHAGKRQAFGRRLGHSVKLPTQSVTAKSFICLSKA